MALLPTPTQVEPLYFRSASGLWRSRSSGTAL